MNKRRAPAHNTHQGLLEVSARAGRTRDFEKSIEIIAAYGVQSLNCDACVVLVSRTTERSVLPVAVVFSDGRPSPVEDGMALRLGRESAVSQAIESGRVLTLVDGEQDVTISTALNPPPGSMVVIKPMDSDSGPVGVMAFCWTGRSQALDSDELLLLSMLSGQAAANVVRGRLFRELERSEEKFRMLAENATDIIFTLDSSGRFTYLNPRVAAILGREPGALIGTYYSEIVSPPSWEASQEATRNAERTGKNVFTYEWIAKSARGEDVHLEVRASFIKRLGAVTGQQGIARDVTERRRMQAEIERRGRELSQSLQRQSEMHDYLALVTQVQEEERRRIARELHDDAVQSLVAIGRQLEILSVEVREPEGGPEKRIQDMMSLTDSALAGLRRFTRDLRPPVLDDLGLDAALEWLTSSFRERVGKRVVFSRSGPSNRLSPQAEVALYRIAQEALNNAVKHSGADTIDILLEYSPDDVTLSVKDDGCGFAPGERREKASTAGSSSGLGILGMQERAQLLGGTLEISSRPGSGATIMVRIPLNKGR